MRPLILVVVALLTIACGGAKVVNTATPGATASAPRLTTTIEPATMTPTTFPGPTVQVGDTTFPVELAVTSEERTQGLSDRPSLDPGTGMLFIFEEEKTLTFWMKDMQFPLDMVWIDAQCRVVDITFNAPPPGPGQTLAQLPRFSPSGPSQYVLEINAGEAEVNNISRGDAIEFVGTIRGEFGC